MQVEFTGMIHLKNISAKSILLLAAIVFCMFSSTITAQVPDQFEHTSYLISADLNLLGETLSNIEVDTIGSPAQHAAVSLSLVQGELHVNYTLSDEIQKEVRNGKYHVDAIISLNDDVLHIRPDKILGDYGPDIAIADGTHRGFIVTDLIEDYVSLIGKLKLQLNITRTYEVVLDFDFNCNVKPQFTTGQKIPYLVGGVVGVGLGAWGIVMVVEAKDKHNTYKRKIYEDKDLYNEANREYKTAQALMIAGGAILVTDIVLYVIRNKNYKKRKKIYDKYCPNDISFRPVIELPGVVKPSGTVGLAMTYTF